MWEGAEGFFVSNGAGEGFFLKVWVGAIVLGLAYLVFLKSPEESAAFIVGQIVLGVVGVVRELGLQSKVGKGD